MKKNELARRLARIGRISQAKAADQLDSVVHRILRNLRQGEAASLPGLGTFQPGGKPRFEADSSPPARPPGRKEKL
jgi:nucleoid DNA-binding protein